MELNEEQYERIARALDGQQVELTDQERNSMESIIQDEQWLGRSAGVAMPALMEAKSSSVIKAELHGRRRIVRIIANVTAAAAIAAVLVMAVTMLLDLRKPVTIQPDQRGIPAAQLEKFIQPGPRQAEVNLLLMELDQFEADVAIMNLPPPQTTPMEVKIDSFEKELDEFLLKNS